MKQTLLISLLAVSLSACSDNQSTEPSQTASTAEQKASLTTEQTVAKANEIYADFFKENLERNPIFATFIGVNDYNDRFGPIISEESRADSLQFEKDYLARISALDFDKLSGQDRISADIFKLNRETAIRGTEFPSHLIPINQMFGVHNFYAQLGSGQSAQPFATEQDYRNFMKRSEGFVAWMDSAIASMREGVERGVVQPEVVMRKVLPQLAYHLVDDVTESVFYGPVKNMPESIGGEAREALTEDYTRMISEKLIPSYRRMHDFIQDDYLPNTRKTFGLSELPGGKEWYEYQIQVNTTLPLTAEKLHELGKKEVARIRSEMLKVKEQMNFEGDLAAFFEFLKTDEQFYFKSEQELVDAYDKTRENINARLPQLFNIFPKADYEVRAVEAYRAASSAGAMYQAPAPDGSRPGIFYINAYNLKAQPKFLMETLSIHEASPGHHFQVTIQQEIEGLPSFRRFGGYTVFSEGWALYAESLGKEMGLFTDPMMWYGRLVDEQLRAMRLVVDTGLHAFGWSREQAIEFMTENSSMNETDVIAEVERYIAIPGQAVSYKVGQFKIAELRKLAESELGERFDIKDFHTQILIDGAMPMPTLEAKIKRWIKESQATKSQN